MLVTADQRRRG